MKKAELEKLLERLDTKDYPVLDFSDFTNPEEAKRIYNDFFYFREIYNDPKDFSPYFTEKVMGKILLMASKSGLEEYLSIFLYRVVAYGVTAVILVFAILMFLQGQDGIGTAIGTESTTDLNFISSLFYEF